MLLRTTFPPFPHFFLCAQMDRGGVACRVAKVDYELPARGDTFEPPTVAAVATLLATGPQASAVGGGQPHEVSLRPSDCAEFLVPKRKVMKVRWLNRGAELLSAEGREGHFSTVVSMYPLVL